MPRCSVWGKQPSTNHWEKAREAGMLHQDHDLPDISDLMKELNNARKANAYGDDEFDEEDADAEDTASSIEEYFDSVRSFLDK